MRNLIEAMQLATSSRPESGSQYVYIDREIRITTFRVKYLTYG